MPKDYIDPSERIEAIWCTDSETGERCLMDLINNRVLLRLPINTNNLEDNKPSNDEQ